MLLMANNAEPALLGFCDNAKKGGLLVIGTVVLGTFREANSLVCKVNEQWWRFIRRAKLKAFPKATAGMSFREGTQQLIHCGGLGGMTVNTVVVPLRTARTSRQGGARSPVPWHQGQALQPTEMKVDAMEMCGLFKDILSVEKNLIVTNNFSAETSPQLMTAWFNPQVLSAGPIKLPQDDRVNIDVWIVGDYGFQESDAVECAVRMINMQSPPSPRSAMAAVAPAAAAHAAYGLNNNSNNNHNNNNKNNNDNNTFNTNNNTLNNNGRYLQVSSSISNVASANTSVVFANTSIGPGNIQLDLDSMEAGNTSTAQNSNNNNNNINDSTSNDSSSIGNHGEQFIGVNAFMLHMGQVIKQKLSSGSRGAVKRRLRIFHIPNFTDRGRDAEKKRKFLHGFLAYVCDIARLQVQSEDIHVLSLDELDRCYAPYHNICMQGDRPSDCDLIPLEALALPDQCLIMNEVLRSMSADSCQVLLELPSLPPTADDLSSQLYVSAVTDLTRGLPPVAMCKTAQRVPFICTEL